MALETKLYQKLTQQLVMTPQLRMAIKILQVGRMELEALIVDEMSQNPVLEEVVEASEEQKADATFETSEAGRDQGAAAVKAAQAAYDVAVSNVDVAKAQQAEAQAQLAELKTTLAKAERDLSFTAVRAPVDGTFSNRLVSAGDFVAVGQRLGNVVPLDNVYIDANFKETQLKRIRPGQPVTIKVDAYGMRKFSGVVDSIAAGAGSVFTLLPPDNATGNFTKIVQRVPVRIRVPKSVAKQNLLRAGMSVYATVDTNKGAADADSEVDLDDATMIHPQ